MNFIFNYCVNLVASTGEALFFLLDAVSCMVRGKIRWKEVLKQVYVQGVQSVVIIALTSLATGAVLALQSYVMLNRFGA